MIEPTGTPVDVLGVKNNQSSKAPNAGKGQRQDAYCVPQAQDTPGFGKSFTAGINDEQAPGRTVHPVKQAQDAGSVQAGISVGAKVNKGAPDWEGTKPIDLTPAKDLGTNGDKSVDGNITPGGRVLTGQDKDIGTSSGMLFPGIIE